VPGESATYSVTYDITEADIVAGGLSNEATVTTTSPDGSNPGATSDPATTDLEVSADVTIAKAASYDDGGDGVDNAGDTVTYTITVSNPGNVTLTDVAITDTLSRGIAPEPLTSVGSLTLTFDGADDGSSEGGLKPGETATYSVAYNIVEADIVAGGLTNLAEVDATAAAGTIAVSAEDDVTTELTATTEITSVKTANYDAGGDGVDHAGDTVDYTITVTNAGNITLTNVTVEDVLTDGKSNAITPALVPVFDSATEGSSEGVLKPGEVATYRVSYDITEDNIVSGGLRNIVNVTSAAQGFTDPVTHVSDPADITLTETRELQATLTLVDITTQRGEYSAFTDAGDEASYTLTVRNLGNTTVNDLQINGTPGLSNAMANAPALGSVPASAIAYAVPGNSGLVAGNCQPVPLAPGETAECDVTPWVITPENVADGGVSHSVTANGTTTGGAAVSDISDTGAGTEGTNDPTLTGPGDTDPTNDPTIFPLAAPDNPDALVTATKTVNRDKVIYGDSVTYTLTFENTSGVPLADLMLHDNLPTGVIYTPDTAMLDGTAAEPTHGQTLSWGPVDLANGASVTITFDARVVADVADEDLVNQTWVADLTGARVSNIATATVRIEAEAVFDCTDIIGKVFDDLNANGYQDEGEPGLAGVQIATVQGEVITTDQHGRYHVPCIALPQDIGSNVILKLDERSLPTGYNMSTENPRVLRVTAGKMARMNFGATIADRVQIDLDTNAFVTDAEGDSDVTDAFKDAARALASDLATAPAVIELRYHRTTEPREIATERLDAAEAALRAAWRGRGGAGLAITREISRQR